MDNYDAHIQNWRTAQKYEAMPLGQLLLKRESMAANLGEYVSINDPRAQPVAVATHVMLKRLKAGETVLDSIF